MTRGRLTAITMVAVAATLVTGFSLRDILNPGIDCAPPDRACLLDAAHAQALANFRDEEIEQNHTRHAQAAASVLSHAAPEQRPAMLDAFRDAGADDAFVAAAQAELDAILAADGGYTIDALAAALDSGRSQDTRPFHEYVRGAFEALRETHPDDTIALLFEHIHLLWQDAFATVEDMHEFMARTDVAALERYAAAYRMPRSGRYNPWEWQGAIAADRCRVGETEAGERILALLEAEIAEWDADRERQAMDRADLTLGILHCRGADAAFAMIEPVLAQMRDDLAAAEDRYEGREREFVLGVIHSAVMEGLIQPLVLHLHRTGRGEEARALYDGNPIPVSGMTIGAVLDEGILGMEFSTEPFESFINAYRNTEIHGPDPRLALSWYVEDFMPDYEICCTDQQVSAFALEHVEAQWPEPPARTAAERVLAEFTDLSQAGDRYVDDLTMARLTIATLERRTHGCMLSDDALAATVDAIDALPFDDQKVPALLAMVRYLDTAPAGAADAAPCIVR